jgi:hypothetical protein
LILQNLEAITENPLQIRSKRKAITALFPYAALLERDGQPETLEMFFRVARASGQWGFIWHRVRPHIATLLGEESSVPLKRAMVHAFPHIPWHRFPNSQHFIQLWAAAASALPYTLQICQSVVDALLHIATQDYLRPHIPVGMWSCLSRQPPFPLVCWGRFRDTQRNVVQTVRGLGDTEILKSYMLLVWSERDHLGFVALHEMCTAIQEDFCGAGMGHDRQDLLQHLDCVLTQLDLGLEHLRQREPNLNEEDVEQMKYEYGELKKVLLEADVDARATLTVSSFNESSPSTHLLLHAHPQDST